MNRMRKYGPALLVLVLFPIASIAQTTLRVGIVKDAAYGQIDFLANEVKSEITALSQGQGNVVFTEKDAGWQPEKINRDIEDFLSDPAIDIVVTLGYLSSDVAANLTDYPKPVIAANILDPQLQGLSLLSERGAEVSNFSYIPTRIRLASDMISFHEMFGYSHLVVLLPKPLYDNFEPLRIFLEANNPAPVITFLPVTTDIAQTTSEIPSAADAALVFPLLQNTPEQSAALLTELNDRHIPSLAVGGPKLLHLGATITFTPQITFQEMARHIALRVSKISGDTDVSDILIEQDEKQRTPIINMASLRKIDAFPANWASLENAILVNVEHIPGEELGLRQAIALALENSVQGKISDSDLLMAQKDVRIAQSNVLPQMEVAGSAVQLSQNLVEASMGQRGEFTVTGSASLKQVIYSETAFANIAIKKLMAQNEEAFNRQTTLDIVTDISKAYITLLFAKSNLQIKNENVATTLRNLEMAKAREQVGEGGISDVNRWISELSFSKMDLNDAQVAYKVAMYGLNELLNRPIAKEIPTPENIDTSIVSRRDLLSMFFADPKLTEKYADFLIDEMNDYSPELERLQIAGQIVDRKKSMYIRQLFVPEVALFGQADQAFIREGTMTVPNLPIPPPPDDITWNAGVRLSIPILQGGRNRAEAQHSAIERDKITWQRQDLLNNMEKGIRSSVQVLKASYQELALVQNAADAAQSNYETVSEAYFQGMATIVQLIDAQNTRVRTKTLVTGAYHQYLLDYIKIERLQGKFFFLEQESEKDRYQNRMLDYLTKQDG